MPILDVVWWSHCQVISVHPKTMVLGAFLSKKDVRFELSASKLPRKHLFVVIWSFTIARNQYTIVLYVVLRLQCLFPCAPTPICFIWGFSWGKIWRMLSTWPIFLEQSSSESLKHGDNNRLVFFLNNLKVIGIISRFRKRYKIARSEIGIYSWYSLYWDIQ